MVPFKNVKIVEQPDRIVDIDHALFHECFNQPRSVHMMGKKLADPLGDLGCTADGMELHLVLYGFTCLKIRKVSCAGNENQDNQRQGQK